MTARSRAYLLLALDGALIAAAVVLLVVVEDRGPHLGSATTMLVASLPATLVAALLVDRRPGSGVGRCLAVLATGLTASTVLRLLGRLADERGTAGQAVLDRVADGLFVTTLPVLCVLVVVFPYGATGTWRSVAHVQTGALGAALVAAATGLDTGPLRPVVRPVAVAAVLLVVLAGLVRVVALVRTWRRTSGEEREPYTWFVTGAASIVVLYLVALPGLVTGAARLPSTTPDAYVIGVLPAALGLSIVRRRLYGLDLVVNRTLVLSATSAALLLAYLSLAGAASAVGAAPDGLMATALPAVAVALVLSPVRSAAQRAVDRALYGDRDEPARALRRLGEQLAGAVAPEHVPERVVAAVRAATRSPGVVLHLDDGRRVSEGSEPPESAATFVLEHAGERLGSLAVAPRSGEQQLDGRDLDLLRDLSRQAAVALYAGQLATELAASRERLVLGREQERARLRRDLHDELSPALAGIGLTVAAARARLPKGAGDSDALLRRVADEAQQASGVVRKVLAGLEPPGLAELGLLAALEERTEALASGSDARVTIHCDGVPAVDAAVEVAAYRIAIEGVANALRHSGGTNVAVRLEQLPERLLVAVSDDGTGVPVPLQEGVGLASARERASEVGGSLAVRRGVDGGTVVLADLPASAVAQVVTS